MWAEASRTAARKLRASLMYRMAMPRKCFRRLKKRSIRIDGPDD
jgi:hypothetical protein